MNPRRRSHLVRAVVLVLAAVGIGVMGWTWRHPGVFAEQGAYQLGAPQRGDRTVFIGMGSRHEPNPHGVRVVTLHDVQPRTRVDSGRATVELFRCRPRSGDQSAVGSGSLKDVQELCKLSAVDDGTQLVVSGTRQDYLLMAVTLSRDGVYEAAGIDVSYSAGWRTGSQHVGPDAVVTRRPGDESAVRSPSDASRS